MRQFQSCNYGPMQLRRMLRARLMQGEVLVGWASVERAPGSAGAMFHMALGLTPVLGPVLVLALMQPRRRLLVLTDARLFVLETQSRTGRGGPGLVIVETPVQDLRVRQDGDDHTFLVALDGKDPPQRLRVPKQRSGGAERLREALTVLASEADEEGVETDVPSAPATQDRSVRSPWAPRMDREGRPKRRPRTF